MIDVKQAVRVAKEKATEMLDVPASNLEEIERESYKGQDVWSITLSYPKTSNLKWAPAFEQLASLPVQYKRFLIDTESGELVAMKLREFASE